MPLEPPDRIDSPPAVQVFALGGFKVVVGGSVLSESVWRRKTARQLFKILLGRPNHRITRDEADELLWPESDPDAASSNLRSTIHAMRRALDPHQHAGAEGIVLGDRDNVWLRTDVELWVDAEEFENVPVRGVRQCRMDFRSSNPGRCAAAEFA
jgi:DNA-binding SARP family transcriptional activator